MKTWSRLPILAILLTGLLMYNCKKKETDPLEPNPGLVDDIGKVDIPTVDLDQPAPVDVTASSVTASAAVAQLGAGLAGLASGTVPESLNSAAADVSASLSGEEVAALAGVDNATINAVAAGGELSPGLKSIMDKVASDPKLNAYLPSFTLPKVNGQEISARIGASDLTDRIGDFEDVAASDECLSKANEAFNSAKTRLDESRANQLAAVTTAYNNAVAALPANQTSCTADLGPKYDAQAAAAIATSNAALAALEAGRAVLGEQLFATLSALNSIALLGHLSTLNTLKAADTQACTAVTAAATTAAQAARDANAAKVEAAYQTALTTASDLRTRLLQSCHNQGGGN